MTGSGQGDANMDPEERAELKRAMQATTDRLRQRGARVQGNETGDELANMLDAVERFEEAVESRGGDLMVDEAPEGHVPEPDDVHFVLPRRNSGEPAADYVARIDEAAREIRQHRPIG